MKTNLKTLASLGLGVALLSLTAALAPIGDDHAKLGEKAPEFKLSDLDGKQHSLTDFAGKTVVLEWTNPSCPYIVGSYQSGVVADTVSAMKKMGDDYVYIAINSTARGVTKEGVIRQNTAFLTEHGVDIPVLVDFEGEVGHMYGAKTTPHVYVIDGDGVLRYNGAYTDDKSFSKDADDRTNYVLNALNQIAAGETVSPDYVKPWGCGVKYAK